MLHTNTLYFSLFFVIVDRVRHATLFFLILAGITSWGLANTAGQQFRANMGEFKIHWNPQYAITTAEAQLFTALHEGLVIYHPATLTPIPGLAESWEISEDKLQINFKIRKNALWSNGQKITSMDFRKSWMKLLESSTGSDFATMLDDVESVREYRNGTANDIGVQTPDPDTLILNLLRPSPHLLSILCHYSFVPVHKDFRKVKDWSALKSIPVSGPYIIRSRKPDELLLDKNPYYWDKESVQIPSIKLTFSSDSKNIVESFNRLQLDWVISGIDDMEGLTYPESLNIAPLFSTSYYYFNNSSSPWSETGIRRALALLIPWEDLRKDRLIPGATLVPPIPNYPESKQSFPPAPQRLEQAKKLLEEAGYPLGKDLPKLRIRISGEDQITKTMKKLWEETLGLEVEIQVVDFSDYYDSLEDDGYDIAHVIWTGDYADPYSFLSMWISDSSFNDAQYSNQEYDAIIERAVSLPFLERYSEFKKAEEILLYSAQVLPIEHSPAWNVIDRRFVGGWFENALDIHPFKDITLLLGYDIPSLAGRFPDFIDRELAGYRPSQKSH